MSKQSESPPRGAPRGVIIHPDGSAVVVCGCDGSISGGL